MNRFELPPKFRLVDLMFRPPSLAAGLGFHDALFNCFQMEMPRQSRPASLGVSLEDDVRVDKYRPSSIH